MSEVLLNVRSAQNNAPPSRDGKKARCFLFRFYPAKTSADGSSGSKGMKFVYPDFVMGSQPS